MKVKVIVLLGEDHRTNALKFTMRMRKSNIEILEIIYYNY